MPNAFQFIDKKTNQPEKFSVIDDKLCAFLGVEPDPKRYYRGWYDVFGYEAAIGWDFKTMIEKRDFHVTEPTTDDDKETLRMLRWFDENYTTTAWYSPK